jgi:hypothetical protein
MRHDGVVHALLLFLLDVIDFAHHGGDALRDVALASVELGRSLCTPEIAARLATGEASPCPVRAHNKISAAELVPAFAVSFPGIRVTALRYAIGLVILGGADPKMTRVDARRIVAGVANAVTGLPPPIGDVPSDAMREKFSFGRSKNAIPLPVSCAPPWPAFIRPCAFEARQERRNRRIGQVDWLSL